MLDDFLVKHRLGFPHLYLTSCVSWIYFFGFTYLSIHVSSNGKNVMFGGATNKGEYQIIEGV